MYGTVLPMLIHSSKYAKNPPLYSSRRASRDVEVTAPFISNLLSCVTLY